MISLDELAARCGIQECSTDVFGSEHQTTPELKRALLQAMRLNVADEEQARAVLDELQDKDWRRPLPPVIVAYKDPDPAKREPISIPVVLPRGTGPFRWRITLESSDDLSGEAHIDRLHLLESRDVDGQRLERRTLTLNDDLPCGYHRLRIEKHEPDMLLIVTPGKCWIPPEADERRLWGVAANLYQLRSQHNWGIGDYTDLRDLLAILKDSGADALGLNPLHAMFLDKPDDASPYSPSDRLLLNVLNIDVETIPEFAQTQAAQQMVSSQEFQEKLAACRESSLVDYRSVTELKLAVLPLLFQTFEQQQDPKRLAAFDAFHEDRRDLLDRACLFQALRTHFTAQDPSLSDCNAWPEEYRSSTSPAVAQFAAEHAGLVRYQLWLQWVADSQLKQAAEAAHGMSIGLYRDLAVGSHPTGAEVWTHPEALVAGAHVGAPPDILNRAGQNWGLPPLHPIGAREQGYASFTELLRANMRYAGALRIDHAMALLRLYWIPAGKDPKDGAYVHYPIDDLIGILALESQRAHCVVIGEALGTVPEGLPQRFEEANILSYRVLYFEIDEETKAFIPPDEYPYLALSVAGNHDLATVCGWWESSDLDLREAVGLFPNGSHEAREERAESRNNLIRALRDQHLLGSDITSPDDLTLEVYSDAVHRFLARTNCLLSLVQLDDMTCELAQVNLPGTTDQHANWRRRAPVHVDELAYHPRLKAMADLIKQEREAAKRSLQNTEPSYQL